VSREFIVTRLRPLSINICPGLQEVPLKAIMLFMCMKLGVIRSGPE